MQFRKKMTSWDESTTNMVAVEVKLGVLTEFGFVKFSLGSKGRK